MFIEFLLQFTDLLAQLWLFVFRLFEIPFSSWSLAGVNGLTVVVSSIFPPYVENLWELPWYLCDFLGAFANITGTLSTIFIPENAPFFFHFVFSGTAVSIFIGVVRVILGWIGDLFG